MRERIKPCNAFGLIAKVILMFRLYVTLITKGDLRNALIFYLREAHFFQVKPNSLKKGDP